MKRASPPHSPWLALLFLCTCLPAHALIMVGHGNNPVNDAGWPAGALDLANLKTRVGWFEGPPFGGGEWCFMYRGNSVNIEEAIKAFAAIRAPALQIFLHQGPQNSTFLQDANNPASDTHYDWSFTVWRPQSWHQLYNDPRSTFTADSPNFRKPVDPPRLDIYLTDKIDWKKITLPEGVQLIDERATDGAKPEKGCALRGDVFDMATGKPIAGAQVTIERQSDKPNTWEKLASAPSNAIGRFEVTFPPGNCRITASATGYAPRLIGYQEFKNGEARKQVIELSTATKVTGTVTDQEGKPLPNIQIRADNIMGIDGRGYSMPDRPQVKSDSAGRFTLVDLPTGFTQVFAFAPGWFHVGSLKLYASPDPQGIAVQMVATGAVKGKVVDANGQPAAGGTINVSPPGDPIGKWGGSMNVAADGTFSFDSVPPGPYTVSTQPQFPGSKPDPNAKEIQVESGKTLNVTVKK
jgi:hypothetical protein